MTISREQLLKLLDFPEIWYNVTLYPDELFEIQRDALVDEGGNTAAPEHYRWAAFMWWLEHTSIESRHQVIDSLTKAALHDPDRPMARSAILSILKNGACSPELSQRIHEEAVRAGLLQS